MEHLWVSLSEVFNTREIATGIWLCVVLVFCLAHPKIRPSLGQVVLAILNRKILSVFAIIAINLALVVFILFNIGLWVREQLPATAIWYLFSGIGICFRVSQINEGDRFFTKLFWDNLKIAAVFEFVVVAYTFSLPVEIVFVPAMAFLGATIAYASFSEDLRPAKVFLEVITSIVLLVVLWHSIKQIWFTPTEFFSTHNGLNFILPALLTIGLVPLVYLLHCYNHYEGVRNTVGQKTFQTDQLKARARTRFFAAFFFRPWLMRRAARQFVNLPAKTNEDIAGIILDIRAQERQRKNPPQVDQSKGWSPHAACDLLAGHGLQTNDYHQGFEDEWWAESGYIDLDGAILPNTAAFYLEGEKGLVHRLKLKGHFRDEFANDETLDIFSEIACDLLVATLPEHANDLRELVWQHADFKAERFPTQIEWSSERYPNDRGYEIYFTMERGLT